MYETALILHSILRLAVVVVTALVVFRALRGWLGKLPWTSSDRVSALVLTILVDLQLVIGILLHLVWSPVTKDGFANMGTAMKEPSIRKFLVEHPVMMIGGVALVHAAKVMTKNAPNDTLKHRRVFFFVGVALILFFVGSPWPWQAVPREWLRMPG